MNDITKYRHPHPNNPSLYAYVEAPIEALMIPIPEGLPNSSVIEDGVERQKTIGEYSLATVISNDGTKAIVQLAMKEGSKGRSKIVTEEDLTQWETYLATYGFPEATWMNFLELAGYLQASGSYGAPAE